MKNQKKTLATMGLVLMTGFFMMITISSPAREMRGTEGQVEHQMRENTPVQELPPGDPIQHDKHPDMDGLRLSTGDINKKPHVKSNGVRFTVDSDALINSLTVGRGGGDSWTNTAIGESALYFNTEGEWNTAIGREALYRNTSGGYNTAIGESALSLNTSGDFNTAIGDGVLYFNTEGDWNTAIGESALYFNTTGGDNTAIGGYALFYNRANSRSTAIGYEAMRYAEDREDGRDTYNTALGYQALRGSDIPENNTGQWNTAIGSATLSSNTSGSYNTANGYQALLDNTTGHNNTASGRAALRDNTTGLQNTAVGDYAGAVNTDIHQGTFIGKSARAGQDVLTNVTAIGYDAVVSGNNQVMIGNSSVTHVGSHAGWFKLETPSKYKSNLRENVPGLDFILKLRPVTYNMDVHKLSAFLGEDIRRDEEGKKLIKEPCRRTLKSRDAKSAIVYSGFVAQEVEAVSRDMGYDFSGISAPENEKGLYSINYAAFTVPIVKAIQEQQQQIETLMPEGMDELLGKVAVLEADNATLAAEQKVLQQANDSVVKEQESLREANQSLLTQQKALKQANELLITEQEVLRAENEQMRGQIGDILDLMAALGVEIQQCCTHRSDEMGYAQDELQPVDAGNAWLEQNAPNPFQENTLIRYYLPEGVQQAGIIITDVSGNRIKGFSLSSAGHGQILISGGTMKAGTYVYTLTVDGRQADSKRMVLL